MTREQLVTRICSASGINTEADYRTFVEGYAKEIIDWIEGDPKRVELKSATEGFFKEPGFAPYKEAIENHNDRRLNPIAITANREIDRYCKDRCNLPLPTGLSEFTLSQLMGFMEPEPGEPQSFLGSILSQLLSDYVLASQSPNAPSVLHEFTLETADFEAKQAIDNDLKATKKYDCSAGRDDAEN